MEERYGLALERIESLVEEAMEYGSFDLWFKKQADFLLLLARHYNMLEDGTWYHQDLEQCKQENYKLYEDVLVANYENSFTNPSYAVKMLGEDYGKLFSFVASYLRGAIQYVYEKDLEMFTSRMELFLEIYASFQFEWEESKSMPGYESLKEIVYWFVSDYSDILATKQVEQQVLAGNSMALNLVKESDLKDLRYLYRYGKYVSNNEFRIASFLLEATEETINTMAYTFIDGYRKGFEVANKDLTKKDTAGLRYHLGFERVIRKALERLSEIPLNATASYDSVTAGNYNKQYQFDHKDDLGLFWDKRLLGRKIDVIKAAFEHEKEAANKHAGPAVLMVFGEEPFSPVSNADAVSLNTEQQKLYIEYQSQYGQIVNKFIPGEERSFTIIAFPLPEIGEPFEEIFDEIIRINTLDYKSYETMQQHIIDVLDKAEYVRIKGAGDNKTDLRVALHHLEDPSKQTNFENCVADVNIPVGEVFTSPKLTNTDGILHVSKVYLRDFEYQNLEISFKDGMITEYSCSNFEKDEENKKFIFDNLLNKHDSLPIGEFAIGTNTVAYEVANKYNIGHKLPILIAEKMGPHFAIGDTCYSHAEDSTLRNPNGKEIIAKDNEVSVLRKTDMSKAYFNCHTDITIPYHELDSIVAIDADQKEHDIIRDGVFVVEGCELLNEPLKKNR